jgi:hypothetical protein
MVTGTIKSAAADPATLMDRTLSAKKGEMKKGHFTL